MINTAQANVGTTATPIVATSTGGLRAVLSNGGPADVFIGPSGVTTGTGFKLPGGGTISVQLDAGEAIFGVVASGTSTVSVLTGGSA